MAAKLKTDEEVAADTALKRDIGHRLRLVRRVLDLNQKEFAAAAGLSSNHYNMIEQGERYPSFRALIALCEAHRITSDWVLRAEPGDMSARLWEGIKALRNAEHD